MSYHLSLCTNTTIVKKIPQKLGRIEIGHSFWTAFRLRSSTLWQACLLVIQTKYNTQHVPIVGHN